MSEKSGFLKRASDAVKADLQRGTETSADRCEQPETQQVAAKDAWADWRQRMIAAGELYEYKVESVRETIVGDKIPTDRVEALMNQRAQEGWHVRAVTSATVGRGGASGLIITFERRVWS
jgi:hypothetical protein